MRRRQAVSATALGLSACFSGGYLQGLPCESDADCGRYECKQGYCGGPPGGDVAESGSGSAESGSGSGTGSTGETTAEGSGTAETDTSTTDPTESTTEADTETDTGCPTDGCACEPPDHTACDDGTTDLLRAIGLDCPGELDVMGTTTGSLLARGVRTQFGASSTFDPQEGDSYAVLGSGFFSELGMKSPDGDDPLGPTFCNDDLGMQWDMADLPMPMTPTAVMGDCIQNPGLVGTGDCSGSLQAAFMLDPPVHDYSALRVTASVPDTVTSFSVDFAFFSTEWPGWDGGNFNDLVVAWLESDEWTGNIAYDDDDNPISVNSGLLALTDPNGVSPDFADTCMRYHAGTGWLRSTAPVAPMETVEITFGIFDMQDSVVDSYVFLDNFRWGCAGGSAPTTAAAG